jgi:hypothetical protein
MCDDTTDLSSYPPKFAGQKTYCKQTEAWYIAVLSSNSGKLLWTIIKR